MISKTLVRFLIFIISLVLIDLLVGITLEKLYYKQQTGLYYRTTYAIDSTKAEVLILGASTANHHHVPQVYSNELDMACYNAGRDGQGIFYFLAVQKAILQRYKPKIIILDINSSALASNSLDYDRLNSLLPYYRSHKEIRSIVSKRSKYEKIKMLSRTYPYNSMLLTILANLVDSKSEKTDNGYIPLFKTIKENKPQNIRINNNKIDISKEKAFKSFIQNCKTNKIELYVIRSPYYSLNIMENLSWSSIQKISKQMEVKLLDYSNVNVLSLYAKKKIQSLMADPGHLNDLGAKSFSTMICQQIINDMNYKKKN